LAAGLGARGVVIVCAKRSLEMKANDMNKHKVILIIAGLVMVINVSLKFILSNKSTYQIIEKIPNIGNMEITIDECILLMMKGNVGIYKSS
jgi:hypothetical protein